MPEDFLGEDWGADPSPPIGNDREYPDTNQAWRGLSSLMQPIIQTTTTVPLTILLSGCGCVCEAVVECLHAALLNRLEAHRALYVHV